MKSVVVLALAATLVAAEKGDFPVSLPQELYADVNKNPRHAVNIFMEASDEGGEASEIAISQQHAALYGASALQEFGARRSFRNRNSFLEASPGAATAGMGGSSVAGAAGAGAAGVGAGAGAGAGATGGAGGDSAALVGALTGLLDQVAAASGGSGSQATGSFSPAADTANPALTQSDLAGQAKINADLAKAAVINDEANNVWASPAEKELQQEIRGAMQAGGMKQTTLGKARAAIFGGSHATSFLSPQSAASKAKISPAELQQISQDVNNAVKTGFSAPRVNPKCPSCSDVNYSACPASFETGANGVCSPGGGYSGFCNRPFLNLGSELEKMEYEVLCETCYPCA